MKKIICVIIFTVLVLTLLLNVFSSFGISLFGFRIYKVGSGSMEPYLKVNETIIIKKSNDYKPNDVITFKDNNEYVTHRIISINDNEIITKGDANNTQDSPITKDKIVGKLIYNFHIMGFISYLLSKPITWIILFVLGLIIISLMQKKAKKIN